MNGSLRRLRLISSASAIVVTAVYVLSNPRPDPLILAGLVSWGLTTLGIWQLKQP